MSADGYKVEKLDDHNYETWCIQMQSVFQIKKLWSYVKAEIKGAENEEKNADALAYLRLSVTPGQLRHLKNAETAYQGWKSLEDEHKKKGPAYEMMLYRRLNQKCSAIEDISGHMKTFFETADEMKACGGGISDKVLVYMLLNSLPKCFEYFEVAMTTRETVPKLSELRIKIEDELMRQKKTPEETPPQDLAGDSQAWIARKSHKGKKNNRNDRSCFNCGKTGHFARDCRVKVSNNKSMYATAFGAEVSNKEWIVDSGANNHFVCSEAVLVKNKRPVNEQVVVADGRSVTALKSGTAVITTNREQIDVKGAMLLPGLKTNLLSVSRATSNGHIVMFTNNEATVMDRQCETLVKARKRNGVYVVESASGNSALIAGSCDKTELWHRRFGHFNYDSLNRMANRNIVNGLENVKSKRNNCEVCHRCKISEIPYPRESENVARELLERVHSDICGPFRTRAICGAKYFVTFIDEKSRYCKIYPLKSREEIGSVFAEYKSFVENQSGRKIKAVRTDNAAEYVGGEFARIIRQSGIRHQTSVARCPQQNGIAERMNRTLVEMTRCMLDEAKLPESLWVEALQTANYLRNRRVTRINADTTPNEEFWGVKPNVQHLRVFGCPVVSLIKGGNRSKFAPKGEVCRLVGYSSGQKGYRLVDKNYRVFTSRNVKFLNESGEEDVDELGEEEPQPTSSTNERSAFTPPAADIRRNPSRACKRVPEIKMNESTEAEVQGAQEMNEEPPIEEEGALQPPTFRVGAGVTPVEPKSVSEAISGPWSKWW